MPKYSADKEIKMYLIAGLGNPGREYVGTRHNIGFEAADALCSKFDIKFNKEKFRAVFGSGTIAGEKVIVAKPQTYMNLSGESIRELAEWYKIDSENIIIMYDDISLPVGKLRIREKGQRGRTQRNKKYYISVKNRCFSANKNRNGYAPKSRI